MCVMWRCTRSSMPIQAWLRGLNGKQIGGWQMGEVRVTRLAVVLAAFALLLFAAPAAGAVRTEFYGIVQGQLDPQDRAGMRAARVQTTRFMLNGRT